MRGEITIEQLNEEYNNNIPNEYDPRLLPTLTRNQIVFFDESHLEQEAGPVYRCKYQIRFPRDRLGRYSPPSPTNPTPIYAPIRSTPSFKYSQQARFCLGVAAPKMPDGRVVGRRSMVFDYTSQRLISIKEYERRVKEEILRVKSLQVNNRKSKWVENHQNRDEYFDEDDVSRLRGIGTSTKTH